MYNERHCLGKKIWHHWRLFANVFKFLFQLNTYHHTQNRKFHNGIIVNFVLISFVYYFIYSFFFSVQTISSIEKWGLRHFLYFNLETGRKIYIFQNTSHKQIWNSRKEKVHTLTSQQRFQAGNVVSKYIMRSNNFYLKCFFSFFFSLEFISSLRVWFFKFVDDRMNESLMIFAQGIRLIEILLRHTCSNIRCLVCICDKYRWSLWWTFAVQLSQNMKKLNSNNNQKSTLKNGQARHKNERRVHVIKMKHQAKIILKSQYVLRFWLFCAVFFTQWSFASDGFYSILYPSFCFGVASTSCTFFFLSSTQRYRDRIDVAI